MQRLRLAAGERYDSSHNTLAQDGIEALARNLMRMMFYGGQNGSGIIAGGAPTYDSGTQRVSVAAMVAADPDGNPIVTTAPIVSAVIAPADIGASGLFVWCAVQPGTTPSATATRVRSTGSEASFSTSTTAVDAVQFKVSASQPAALTNPTATWFKTHTVTAWDGGTPNLPTIAYRFVWANDSTTAAQPNGSVLSQLISLQNFMASLKGTASYTTAPADTLAGLDTRISALESPNDDFVTIPIISGQVTSGTGSYATAGESLTGSGANQYRFGLHLADGDILKRVTLRVSTGVGSTCEFEIVQYDPITGATTIVSNTATLAASKVRDEVILEPTAGTLTVDYSKKYEVKFNATNAGVEFATLHGAWMRFTPTAP